MEHSFCGRAYGKDTYKTAKSNKDKHKTRRRVILPLLRTPLFTIQVSMFILSCFVIMTSRATPLHRSYEQDSMTSLVSAADVDSGVNFLVKYGYLTANEDERSGRDIIRATEDFQKLYGLKTSGFLDGETLTLMKTPRCGLSDSSVTSLLSHNSEFLSSSTTKRKQSSNKSAKGNRTISAAQRVLKQLGRKRRYAFMGRWPKTNITYGFSSYTDDLSTIQQQNAIANALEVWNDGTPLSFTQRWQANVDIMVSFERGYHGDGYPFDGPGHTLAHAFFPGQGERSGDVHFDADERWAYTSSDGTSLFMVAVHEFGHALGLGHSASPGSVMLPFYQGHKDGVSLSDDDRMAVYHLYGGNLRSHEFVARDDPSVFAGPTLTATSGGYANDGIGDELPEPCQIEFDAVANIRNEIHFYKGNFFWRFTLDGKAYHKYQMNSLWPGFPLVNVDAVYATGSKINIFSGNRYWTYDGLTLDSNSPRPISDFGLPMNGGIDAAYVWSVANGATYFFKGSKYWKYDETRSAIVDGYPKDISLLKGVSQDMDGAFLNPNDSEVYFLKGKKCWRMDKNLLSVGTPEYIGVKWFNCDPKKYDSIYHPVDGTATKGENHTTDQQTGENPGGGGGGASSVVIDMKLTTLCFIVTFLCLAVESQN